MADEGITHIGDHFIKAFLIIWKWIRWKNWEGIPLKYLPMLHHILGRNPIFYILKGGTAQPLHPIVFFMSRYFCIQDPTDISLNKATRSPEISGEQVQKLTPQFLLYNCIYIGYRFPLSLSTIWGNHLPVNFMLKFPTCISTIWRNHLPHLTSKWRGIFQSHDKMLYIYYLEKPPPI